MTSETNPETGTIAYVYDTDATCGMSMGDLVKKTDAYHNVTCYAYDAQRSEDCILVAPSRLSDSDCSRTYKHSARRLPSYFLPDVNRSCNAQK